jgi:pilus assembly protein Flp/PilA
MSIYRLLTRLMRDRTAMAAVEYGLICALIILVMLSALTGFANAIRMTWTNIANQTGSAVTQATGA